MKVRFTVWLLSIGAAIIIIAECCKSSAPKAADAPATFVGSTTCQSCHQQEHEQWATSHHYHAMLPATDSTVGGDFNNATFTADGVTSRFFKMDGKFYINTEGEDGQNHDYEVKYVFGYEPLQQYLVEFPGGRMQATRASWDTRKKKWFHQYAGQKIPAGDWLHWTGNAQNWNTMCASCHSTNLKKGYDVQSDTYQTTYNEINVSCESCHGPGSSHVAYASGDDYKNGKKIEGSLIALYKASGQMNEVNTCGYCHARRADISETVPVHAEVLQDYIPALPTNDFFFADGQMNEEDYNYTSFLQSKMFHRGVQCSNCHNPHSGKLKLNGSLVCGQCHATEKYTSEAHTMHSNSLADVNCITCHMPSKVYMGNDPRHDHSFRVPRPDLSAKYGTPNTCNSCHTNKTPQWAAEKVAAHYGANRTYHFAEDLVPGSRLDEKSLVHLRKLLADSAVPNMARAAAAYYAGRINSNDAATTLSKYLADSSALVRQAAARALLNFAPSAWMNAAMPLLQDEVKAIRIAAADLFLSIPSAQIPSNVYTAFTSAKQELERFLLFQTDFALGNQQAGDFYSRQNDQLNAERFYRRAVAKDSQLAIARVNLASTLNANRKNAEALHHLEIAARLEPNSDHIQYTLALLYAEMGRNEDALQAFKKSIAINNRNIRAQYNYGLLLQQMNQPDKAEAVYKAALNVEPTNGDVLNALCILYMQQTRPDLALPYAKTLQQYHGNNPAYADLLGRLRMQ